MGILNEDETISAVRLYRMWIAQGMISHENIGDMDETLTDIAELYLSELVSRSIVQVEIHDFYDVANRARKYRSTCKLHDVVRELCLKLGKSEDFGLHIMEYQGRKLSTLLRDASLNMNILHLVIHIRSQVEHELKVARGGGTSKYIRSLQLTNLTKSNDVEFPQQSILDFRKFKLLRDLVIVGFKFAGRKLPRGITDLVHLRCLRLEACELDNLPPSIRNFVFMDTLDLTDSVNVEVPNAINELLRLKHLIFPPYGDEKVGNYRVILDEGVDELETLACVDSRYHELKCMDRMKNLQRFVAKVHDNESLSAIMNAILNWDKLMHCSLHIEASCDLTSELMLKTALTCPNLDEMVSRPKLGNALGECGSTNLMGSKLRCLDLVGSEIEDDPMGILGKLPCLVRLRFYSKSFIGEEMVCPANSFLHLKKLALMGLPRLSKWRVETGAMPLLSQLTLIRCNCLEMLPEGLNDISTLKSLVIKRMPEMATRVSPSGHDFHKVRHVPSIIIYE